MVETLWMFRTLIPLFLCLATLLNCATAVPISDTKMPRAPAYACKYKDAYWTQSNFELLNEAQVPWASFLGYGRKASELVVPFEPHISKVKVAFEIAYVQFFGVADLKTPLKSFVQNPIQLNAVVSAEKGAALEWVSGIESKFNVVLHEAIKLPSGTEKQIRCEDTRLGPFYEPVKLLSEMNEPAVPKRFFPAGKDIGVSAEADGIVEATLHFKDADTWHPDVVSENDTHVEISLQLSRFRVHGFVRKEDLLAPQEMSSLGGMVGGLGMRSGADSRQVRCTNDFDLFDASDTGVFKVGTVKSNALMHILSRNEKTAVVDFPELKNEIKLATGHSLVIRAEDEMKCFPAVAPPVPAL
jgi:hypothetical protein